MYSLDASCFVNSFRCFVARRDSPKTLRLDNARNHVPAEKVLNEFYENINLENSRIVSECLKSKCDFVFNVA